MDGPTDLDPLSVQADQKNKLQLVVLKMFDPRSNFATVQIWFLRNDSVTVLHQVNMREMTNLARQSLCQTVHVMYVPNQDDHG